MFDPIEAIVKGFVQGNDHFGVIVLYFLKVSKFASHGFFMIKAQCCLNVNSFFVLACNKVNFLGAQKRGQGPVGLQYTDPRKNYLKKNVVSIVTTIV